MAMAGTMPGTLTAAETRKVVFASSLGTVFEWYDFYLFGSLAAIIARNFFSGVNPTAAFIFTLLGFAAGFAVRPFGAIVFGRLGDLIGRKYTFLVTIVIMGSSTALIGILPGFATLGIAAPIILIALRLLQGLALGGEYGGAAVYVAEHAPANKRGLYTSWIQTTATLGLFLSLLVIVIIQESMTADDFASWGWRIPFLLSVVLLGISVWIRLQLQESPVFQKMKNEGRSSKSPLKDSFANWSNLKWVIIALLGATAGQAVVWYCGQFYALFFLTATLKVNPITANILIAVALALGTPFFVVFGWLSDKIGRKPIILGGCLIAALTYHFIFGQITHNANPELEKASAASPVVVTADPATCSFQFNPTGTAAFTTDCDKTKGALARAGVPYSNVAAPAGSPVKVTVGATALEGFDAAKLAAATKAAGYPATAPAIPAFSSAWLMTVFWLWILVIFVTMVYGPIAALLVEMFPARVRYTSLSLPYHIGNGWFGGFLPATAFAIVASTGNIYSGLWYPIIIAVMTLVIGTIFIRERRGSDIETGQ